MSVTKRLSRNEHGDPVVTIRVVGYHDIYRFAHHLMRGQVEFCALGHRTMRSLRRQMGTHRYEQLDDYFTGKAWRDAS